MRWAGRVARIRKKRITYCILIGKAEGQIPLGRPRRRWKNIRMNLREIRWEGLD
jgi:hypothetical protein